jgi:hypothetical protein
MSVLRPRDIQTRIRAGETPEDVASAAQTSVDKIMGFATPVLAERAYQAELAQRASVRRRAATGPAGTLGASVATHLERLAVDPESVEWDAWRREDGRWTVVAAYAAHGEPRQAAFSYDTAGRFVVADDDEARALVGERIAGDDSVAQAATPPSRSVRMVTPDDGGRQLPLGDDAIDIVTGGQLWSGAHPTGAHPTGAASAEPEVAQLQGEMTVDLTEAAAAVRTAGPGGDADWIATQASERPPESTPPAPPPDGGPASEPWDEPGGDTVEGDAREEEQEELDALFEVPATDEQPAPRPARPRGRASVPSWDEIMFGTPKSE